MKLPISSLVLLLALAVSGCGGPGPAAPAAKDKGGAEGPRAAKVLSSLAAGEGKGNYVTALHLDQNTLWIGTKNGLKSATFDPGNRSLTLVQDKEATARFDNLEITDLTGSGSRIVAGTAYGLAVHDTASGWSTEEIGRVNAVAAHQNTIFVGRTTGIEQSDGQKGWAKLEPNPPVQRNQTSAQFVNSLTMGAEGDIWAGTKFGLLKFSPGTGKWDHFYGSYQDIKSERAVTDELGNCDLAGNYVNQVRFDPASKKLLVSTDIGVSVFDGKWVSYTGEHTKYIVKDDNLMRVPVKGNTALPSCVVYATALEGQTIWVGTKNGLARLAGPKLEIFDSERGLPDDSVHALAWDQGSGTLFVGTEGGVAVVGYEGGDEEK